MPIPTVSVEECLPGEGPSRQPQPGDIILTHGNAWTSKLIRVGQSLRFTGESRTYTWWNHVAIVVDDGGDIIEALGAGVQRRNLSVYQPTEYQVVYLDQATSDDREQMVNFAETCVDLTYGWATIASIAFGLITGTKFSFGFDGQYICSGLVARCLERTAYIIPEREHLPRVVARSPSHTMPAHIAEFFDVHPPAPGTQKGSIPPPAAGQ